MFPYKKGLCRCDSVKGLEMNTLTWIIWVSSTESQGSWKWKREGNRKAGVMLEAEDEGILGEQDSLLALQMAPAREPAEGAQPCRDFRFW